MGAAALACAAQTPSPPESAAQTPSQGQVLFSRSSSSPAPPAQAAAETAPAALAASITDPMREAVAFTRYDFTLHIDSTQSALEAVVRTTVRNTSATPLVAVPLQLSSSLHFEHIRMEGKLLPFAVHMVSSDADHTGALTEAVVALPLAPGASADLVIDYGGVLPQSSERLDRIGTPAAIAQSTDWDGIAPGFTGLRGFGDVAWYPVASIPATFAQGERLFHEIDRQKAIDADVPVSMDVTEEFKGDAPNVAVLDGVVQPAPVTLALPTAGFPGVARWSLPPTQVGFAVPSLVLATRGDGGSGSGVTVAALTGHDAAAQAWLGAAAVLTPLFQDWLAQKPYAQLLLVDLPYDGAAPSEDGNALLLRLSAAPPDPAAALTAPLTHVYFRSPRAWLEEGVPGLMSVLWAERQSGTTRAIELLNNNRAALALAEPGTPGESSGEPLLTASDPVYTQTKAAYVLWMLRSLAGDGALGATLRAYDPEKDTTPDYFEKLLEHTLAAQGGLPPSDLPEPAQAVPGANREDLHWFFQNWVYNDPGLPDLSIQNVYASPTGAGDQHLVAITIANSGYAEADVPVTVLSAGARVTVDVRVPARSSIARRVLLLGAPTEVDLNDGSVPEVESSVHRRLIQ